MPPRRSKRLKGSHHPPNSKLAPVASSVPTQSSFFCKFSSEIRNEIYRHLVRYQQIICPPVGRIFKRMEDHETGRTYLKSTRGALAFAGTSRQAHNEVTAIYYGENQFDFGSCWEMQVFLYMIGSHNRQCIQNVMVIWDAPNLSIATDAAALLSECKKMKRCVVFYFFLNCHVADLC